MNLIERNTRAGSTSNKNRQALYRAADEQIGDALALGFPLEAVGLLESRIADRLDSHIEHLTSDPVTFGSLGRLITAPMSSTKIHPWPRWSAAARAASLTRHTPTT